MGEAKGKSQKANVWKSIMASSLLPFAFCLFTFRSAAQPPAEELQIEVTKKGLGKEVVMRRGPKEWYMLVEVTPENTVVIRQEKENENYLLDDSETHDRSMTPAEVDTAINDFINSVKTQQKKK
ncbi:MAG TPA: hypothetical protein VFA38_03835 [Nitrospirales bacterium]|nr:hypothetical protein [Nitrospirales bacterium]